MHFWHVWAKKGEHKEKGRGREEKGRREEERKRGREEARKRGREEERERERFKAFCTKSVGLGSVETMQVVRTVFTNTVISA